MYASPLVFLLPGHLAVVSLRQLPGYLLGNGILTLLGNSGGRRRKESQTGVGKSIKPSDGQIYRGSYLCLRTNFTFL